MYFHLETQALTDALQVLSNSPYHQSWGLSKVGTYIVAPIRNKRLKVVYDRGSRPVGLMTWAYLPPDRELSYVEDPSSLAAMDFASNDGTLWAIDFAAPYGHCREVVRALRECFPRGTKFRIYRTEQNRFGWVVA
jgi:cytolysin-activating lysine-acyltransferase